MGVCCSCLRHLSRATRGERENLEFTADYIIIDLCINTFATPKFDRAPGPACVSALLFDSIYMFLEALEHHDRDPRSALTNCCNMVRIGKLVFCRGAGTTCDPDASSVSFRCQSVSPGTS
jgi:hypothetical protein